MSTDKVYDSGVRIPENRQGGATVPGTPRSGRKAESYYGLPSTFQAGVEGAATTASGQRSMSRSGVTTPRGEEEDRRTSRTTVGRPPPDRTAGTYVRGVGVRPRYEETWGIPWWWETERSGAWRAYSGDQWRMGARWYSVGPPPPYREGVDSSEGTPSPRKTPGRAGHWEKQESSACGPQQYRQQQRQGSKGRDLRDLRSVIKQKAKKAAKREKSKIPRRKPEAPPRIYRDMNSTPLRMCGGGVVRSPVAAPPGEKESTPDPGPRVRRSPVPVATKRDQRQMPQGSLHRGETRLDLTDSGRTEERGRAMPFVALERLIGEMPSPSVRSDPGQAGPSGIRRSVPRAAKFKRKASALAAPAKRPPSISDGEPVAEQAPTLVMRTEPSAVEISDGDEWRTETETADGGSASPAEAGGAPGKRKKGAPQRTTGLYIGRAKAMERCNRADRDRLDLRLEKVVMDDLEGTWNILRGGDKKTGVSGLPTTDLLDAIQRAMEVVRGVSKVSMGLKGSLSSALKKAVDSIGSAAGELGVRTYANQTDQGRDTQDRTAELEARLEISEKENHRLKADLEKLKLLTEKKTAPPKEQRRTRQRTRLDEWALSVSSDEAATGNTRPRLEGGSMEDRLLDKLEKMIDHKMGTLKSELVGHTYVPEKANASSMKSSEDPMAATTAAELPHGSGNIRVEAAPAKKKKLKPRVISNEALKEPVVLTGSRGKIGRPGLRSGGGERLLPPPLVYTTDSQTEGTRTGLEDKPKWTEVVGRKRSRKQGAGPGGTPSGRPAEAKGTGEERGRPTRVVAVGRATRPPQPGLGRLLRTEVVTIACPDDKYGEVMKEARSKIDLREMGLEGVNQRTTRTGAVSLAIAGERRVEKADALAAGLVALFRDRPEIRIARPVIKSEVRVSGLDKTAGKEDLITAIAEVGGCRREEVEASEIRTGPYRMGTAWVRCPAVAARKLVSVEKWHVGWARVRATLLESRPLQCFRCLEGGHVRAECTSQVDRSNRCYRCGDAGHVARNCTGGMRCPVCSDLGKPANHRAGGRACLPSRGQGRARNGPAKEQHPLPRGSGQQISQFGSQQGPQPQSVDELLCLVDGEGTGSALPDLTLQEDTRMETEEEQVPAGAVGVTATGEAASMLEKE